MAKKWDGSENRVVIELDEGWFELDCYASLREEFDDEELAYLRSQLSSEMFFVGLGYNNDTVIDIAITILPLPPEVLVDNDHGLVLPVGEVRRRIKAGEDWCRATC